MVKRAASRPALCGRQRGAARLLPRNRSLLCKDGKYVSKSGAPGACVMLVRHAHTCVDSGKKEMSPRCPSSEERGRPGGGL